MPNGLLDVPASEPARKGEVEVYSWPQGANVSVDGDAIDGLTPLTVKGLAPGNHRITISMEGYQTKEVRVATTPGGAEKVELTLAKQ